MERHAGTQGTLPDVDAGSVTVPLIIHVGLGNVLTVVNKLIPPP
jgi:hypothetical protein